MNKVLVIGLDGATWTLLSRWIEQGYLPHLAGLQRLGSSGVLRSTLPIITSAAWSTLMTGKEPSNTGVFSFYYRDNGSYTVRTNTRLRVNGTSLWQWLTRQGKKSIVINVPMTYPAEEDLNGLMITGLPTPHTSSEGFTLPPNLFEQYHLDKNRYVITVRLSDYKGRYADLVADLKKMERERLRIAKVLIREPWDLFMIHFFATDVAQHALWKFIDQNHPQYDEQDAKKYGNGLLEVFSEVDQAIGELLQVVDLDNTTILVLSDHGFGPNYCTLNINQWLNKIGMLKLYQPLIHIGHWLSEILRQKLRGSSQGINWKLLKFLFSTPGYCLPASWQNQLHHHLKGLFSTSPLWSSLFELRGYPTLFEAVDWKKTRAYSIGTNGLIYINLMGREPKGIVSPGKEYEEVRDLIINELLNLQDENGYPVVDRVYRKEELYHGKFIDQAPDLIPLTETTGCYFYPFLNREAIITQAELFRSGNHRLDGILVATGSIARRNQQIEAAQIIDVAPTILYLLNLPIPHNVDGAVIEQIFIPEYLKQHPIHKTEDSETLESNQLISAEDEDKIAKRLTDLGYL